MPMMMDDEMHQMEMDALFGDDPGLSLPSRPPSKELRQRLDELRGSGCCQSIAWSKWGCIASISPNRFSLELRNLRCHPDNGTWALSEATSTPNFSSPVEGGELKHLCWSPTGSDLAVIDASGRVTVITVFSSLNKPIMGRVCTSDPLDDLHSVVGCYWLNLAPYPPSRPTILHGPAVKEGSDFRYEASQAAPPGPWHPNHSKSALVCLMTNGLLRVLWPQNNGKWFETPLELQSVLSSDDLLTHAAICSDKNGTLLIAFATTSKQLHVMRGIIDWGQPKVDKVQNAQLPLNPAIRMRPLCVTSWVHDTPTNPLNSSHMEDSMVQLSHLAFLPPCTPDAKTPATLVAVRSHLPALSTHYNQDICTTIDRWELWETKATLHPAFEQLSSRRNSVGSQPPAINFLKKLESITVNKIAIFMETMNHGKIVFVAYSDGSVEYRDRITFSETFNDGNLDRVLHLSQIGFTYPVDEPCLEVALSPSYCSVVQLRHDGKVKWQHLDYRLGEIGTSMSDPLYAAVIAALSLSCATAVMRNVNYDDLLATASKHATPQLTYDWLMELSLILKVTADYSEEAHHDTLVRNTTIQLCLCIQNSLGFKGEFNSRAFSGKFAWFVLQLRNIVILVTMAANLGQSGAPNSSSPLEDPEVINSLAGSVRWVLDLMAWLTDTLLSLPDSVPPTIDLTNASKLPLPDLLAHLHSTNTIALHLLLSSPSRGFLTAICRRLQHLDYIARKAIMYTGRETTTNTPNPSNPNQDTRHQPSTLSPALRAAYMQIATLTSSSILRIKTIETLLSSLTSHIKNAYATHNPSYSGSQAADKLRNKLEVKMLFGGSIPDAFKPVIVELFRKEGLLDAVREEIEPAKLFCADFTMLEVDEDAASVKKRKALGATMDSFRKTWLPNPKKGDGGEVTAGGRPPARWRRCARCAAVMEDVLNHRQSLQWLVMQQRRCFCSGYWDTLAPGDMVA